MTDRLVTLTVWILAVGFALACVLFAWRASTAGAPPGVAPPVASGAGAALFDAHCSRCHDAGAFSARLAAPDRAVAAGRLLEKLDDHGGASFADDLAIVQWLAAQATARPGATPEPASEPEDDYSL